MDRSVEEYQKDLLWQTSLETFYRVAYAESLMSSALQKWKPVDSVVKSLVTVTTIASVMVGWMSWGSPAGKVTWLVIAGCAALLGLLHVIFKISDRIADLSHNAQYFKSLRLNLERFIYEMEVNPDFSLESFKDTFEQYREWLLVGSQMLKEDFLLTHRHRQKIQNKLNQQMGDMIL
ncbi:MAG: hypothetical protein OXU36_24560 [Candidatus Poribacteria bacterium]|nr:hypothetical protein [Candidatus Poribacteria bacterium]